MMQSGYLGSSSSRKYVEYLGGEVEGRCPEQWTLLNGSERQQFETINRDAEVKLS